MAINLYDLKELQNKTFYNIFYKDYTLTVGYNIFDDKIIEDQLFITVNQKDATIYECIALNNEIGLVILNNGYRIYFLYQYTTKDIFVFDDEDYDSLE